MRYITAYASDVGIKKETNQDAILIKKARTAQGEILLAIICDGMGGLEKGEVASKEVIERFSGWFHEELPQMLYEGFDQNKLQMRWKEIVVEENLRIGEFGKKNNVNLGTTLTALLVIEDSYYVVHVGDSRIYELSDMLYQITEDQTLVAKEIAAGRLSEEQAETDPRRSVLLQCIGASQTVEPVFYHGKIKEDAVYMLCSDGLRHMCTPMEMWNSFCAQANPDEKVMKNNILEFIEMLKQRQEKDNISCILVKTIR
ncbi:PP2C family protein-serine/threonine phosphatase [Roseburia sp. 499]|uniref:PP2C family protein-serine/threonine phosphatase n=1 Tax=Roseburia sp. 499 TaxID=1261634 RepID=UPI000950BB8B|nr:protein phosphatase 2C domain-containing protein [Roseburia sp. 499]WVK70850.1 protein phosphatase 2C domain-containing protein [Roseburia sp. 499]